MISRIIISLKKTASSQKPRVDLEFPTGSPMSLRDDCSHGVDDINLSVFRNERV